MLGQLSGHIATAAGFRVIGLDIADRDSTWPVVWDWTPDQPEQ